MSGITGTQPELLYTLSSVITKNTYTTQAAYSGVLGTNTVCAVPGGWLTGDNPNPLGRALHLRVFGTIANTAAATFANAIGMDPAAGTINQSIVLNTAYTPTASVVAPFNIDVWYTCQAYATSTCTWQVNGTVEYEAAASGGAAGTARQTVGFAGTHTGIDPRVTNYIELFGTWSASSVSNTTTVQQIFLWGLN